MVDGYKSEKGLHFSLGRKTKFRPGHFNDLKKAPAEAGAVDLLFEERYQHVIFRLFDNFVVPTVCVFRRKANFF